MRPYGRHMIPSGRVMVFEEPKEIGHAYLKRSEYGLYVQAGGRKLTAATMVAHPGLRQY